MQKKYVRCQYTVERGASRNWNKMLAVLTQLLSLLRTRKCTFVHTANYCIPLHLTLSLSFLNKRGSYWKQLRKRETSGVGNLGNLRRFLLESQLEQLLWRSLIRPQKQRLSTCRTPWDSIKEYYGHRCAYCGARTKLTRDHMVPRSRGGTMSKDNIAPACESCNMRKGDQPIWVMLGG